MNTFTAFIGVPGGPELLVILALAVLLFGANKLPKLARSSGQAMGEFKKGRDQVERELRDASRTGEARSEEEAAESA